VALTIGSGRHGRRSTIEVYTRDGCGLCRTAEEIVAREADRAEVRHIDIDQDDALMTRYQVRVPVIVVDGREVAEGRVSPGTVKRALRRSRRARWSQWRRA
jgi:glutaredoxin